MLAVALVAGPAGARPLEATLDEAIRRALEVQPTLVQAAGARRTAGASDRSAWGAFLPTVSTSASATRNSASRVDDITGQPVPPRYNYTLGLGANLSLFDGFRRLAQKKSASADINAADAVLRNERFQVTLATKRLFYDAAAREELLGVAEAQLHRAEQQLHASVERQRAGSGTRSDSLRAAVDVGSARIALLQAQADVATARANLGRQMGVDGPVRALPDSTLPAFPDTLALRELALESAPEVARTEAELRSARAAVWTSRSQYWPTLGVSYSDNHQGTGSPFSNFDDYSETFSWRFGLSWTLFDGFQREADQVQSAVRRDVAEAQAADARLEIGARLTEQIAALSTAQAQIGIAEASVAAATEDVRVQTERYRVGAATLLELSSSQTTLTQMHVDAVQARFNFLIARAEVEALVGGEL
jgi:outer membrane protein TolC